MQISSFTEETLKELTTKQKELDKYFNKIKSFTLKDFWVEDLC